MDKLGGPGGYSSSAHQGLVLDAAGLVGVLAEAAASVALVVGVVALEPLADALLLAIYAYVLYRSPRARKVPE